jgi:hypothetical protein
LYTSEERSRVPLQLCSHHGTHTHIYPTVYTVLRACGCGSVWASHSVSLTQISRQSYRISWRKVVTKKVCVNATLRPGTRYRSKLTTINNTHSLSPVSANHSTTSTARPPSSTSCARTSVVQGAATANAVARRQLFIYHAGAQPQDPRRRERGAPLHRSIASSPPSTRVTRDQRQSQSPEANAKRESMDRAQPNHDPRVLLGILNFRQCFGFCRDTAGQLQLQGTHAGTSANLLVYAHRQHHPVLPASSATEPGRSDHGAWV